MNSKETGEGFGIQFGGEIVKVLDGDTIEVEVRRRVRVRLLDCWAAETRTTDPEEKAKGMEAKKFLTEIALGNNAKVFVPIEGAARFGESMSFGRVLAFVEVNGADLSEAMVAAGLATTEKKRH